MSGLELQSELIVKPGGCGAHQEGEFYDTISASGSCTVRFKTADFGQRMIMVSDRRPHIVHLFVVYMMVLLTASFLQHCHVLNHEDNGAINLWMLLEFRH